MRRKEIENRINDAFSVSVSDVLDNILEICEEKKGFEEKMKKVENKKRFTSSGFVKIMACACVVLFGFVSIYRYNIINNVDSIVEFDVNPSVELKVNKDEDVIEAVALNADGKKVLGDMDFNNVDLDIAVNAIVDSMIKNGYLTVDENSILVSVKNKDVEKQTRLQNEITEEIDEILQLMSIDGAILSQTLDDDEIVEKLAKDNDISVGKAKLINEIIESGLTNSKGEKYRVSSLAQLSINELNLLLNSKDTKVESVTSNGSMASDKGYIGNDKALDIAFKDAGVSSSNAHKIQVEFDCDDGRLVYEVDFKANGKEYEYEINAKDGNIIVKDIERDD